MHTQPLTHHQERAWARARVLLSRASESPTLQAQAVSALGEAIDWADEDRYQLEIGSWGWMARSCDYMPQGWLYFDPFANGDRYILGHPATVDLLFYHSQITAFVDTFDDSVPHVRLVGQDVQREALNVGLADLMMQSTLGPDPDDDID